MNGSDEPMLFFASHPSNIDVGTAYIFCIGEMSVAGLARTSATDETEVCVD
jgi:hypothetical protein